MSQTRREKLLEKKSQIEAQLEQLDAREKQKRRKEDARRKIIAGGLALKHAEMDTEFGKALFALIDRYVDRSQDRALFGLGPKAGPEQDNNP